MPQRNSTPFLKGESWGNRKGGPVGPPLLFINRFRLPQKLGNGRMPVTRQKIVITIVVEKAHQKMKRW